MQKRKQLTNFISVLYLTWNFIFMSHMLFQQILKFSIVLTTFLNSLLTLFRPPESDYDPISPKIWIIHTSILPIEISKEWKMGSALPLYSVIWCWKQQKNDFLIFVISYIDNLIIWDTGFCLHPSSFITPCSDKIDFNAEKWHFLPQRTEYLDPQ